MEKSELLHNIKLALVCTAGGHFEQLWNLSDFYDKYNHFWITNRHKQTESTLSNERYYFINPAHFKKPWEYLTHFPAIYQIFKKERPSHIITTGSGRTCLVPFIFAKIFHIHFIFIETFSRVNHNTIFARFLNAIFHPFFTQWDVKTLKKAIYLGPVFKNEKRNFLEKIAPGHIFVTLGTRTEPFVRLINSVEQLAFDGLITKKVIVQAGSTDYKSEILEIFNFCNSDQIDEYIQNAEFVITQESAGIGTKCLKYKKRFIVMPREYAFGELPSKADQQEDLQDELEKQGYVKVVRNLAELRFAIENIQQLKVGFLFDNSLAINKLTELVEQNGKNTFCRSEKTVSIH